MTNDQPILITRYPNRRLYDRSQGRYVTLQEIAEQVRQGATVRVTDSKTGEDLTHTILTQIILEQHPERMELFPVAMLHMLIGANDLALGLLREYLNQSLGYWQMLQQATPGPPLEWLRAFWPGLPPPAPKAESPPPEASAEAETLARRVAELERRLAQMQAATDKGPRTKDKGQRTKDR